MHQLAQYPALNLAAALVAGTLAQALARHLRIPGIVLLLLVGVLLGPSAAGLIHPSSLGAAMPILVGFAVAVILFEGGLNLDIQRLRQAKRSIRQLVTVGALVTAIGGALTARILLDWPWRTAVLFGTLIIVTGPTVVTPLLRRLRVQRSVATVLEAEGVLIDAIGAIVAAFALEVALSPTGSTFAAGVGHVLARIVFGTVFGLAGGLLLAFVLRIRDLMPEGLENIFALGGALFVFQAANVIVHESGIAAVTVAGLVVGNARTMVHRDLLEFKEQLTVMLIGMLFVLLAADVQLVEVKHLGWPGVYTVVALIFVIRPLSVLVGTWGSDLSMRQRLFIGWIGPRGIIAAAIASLFAAKLEQHGMAGGNELRALVFLVIAVTVLLAGSTGGFVARLMGLRELASGWVIVGAHEVARAFAKVLGKTGEHRVVCVDTNPEVCVAAEREQISVIHGSALDDRVLEQAMIDSRFGAIGLSANEEVNLLFVQKVKREAKLANLYVAVRNVADIVTPQMVHKVGAEVLFGKPEDIELWSVRFRRKLASVERYRMLQKKSDERTEDSTLAVMTRVFLPLVFKRGKEISPISDATRFRQNDEAWFVIYTDRESEARAQLATRGWQAIEPPNGNQHH